jgi:hypothetical protein
MRRILFALVGVVLVTAPLQAADPLRLVPDQANFVVKIEHPDRLAQLGAQLMALPGLASFAQYREFLDSTNARRFKQLVAYFEKELGDTWPLLLDKLAGDGIVLAGAKLEKDAPILAIIQGKDAKLTQRFAARLLDIVEQEAARQEHAGWKRTADTHRGVSIVTLNEYYHVAVVEAAIVYSNKKDALKAAIDLHKDGNAKSALAIADLKKARDMAGPDALVWGWLNLKAVKQSKEVQELLDYPGTQPILHYIAGKYLDAFKQAPFLAVSFGPKDGKYVLSAQLPAARSAIAPVATPHVPSFGKPTTLPLLEPKGTLYTSSFYLDLASFWTDRAKIFDDMTLKAFEEGDKQSATFLLGTRISQILEATGPRQRIVAARQVNTGYSVEPALKLPAFAFVAEARDPEALMKALEPRLRTIALLTTTQAKMTLVEEKIGDVSLIGYRFVENEQNKALNSGILFNFSPCFARVDNTMMFCSTLELARELIPEIRAKSKLEDKTDKVLSRDRFRSEGLSEYLGTIKQQLITQAILGSGSSPEEAAKEINGLLKLIDSLGKAETQATWDEKGFRFEVIVTPEK